MPHRFPLCMTAILVTGLLAMHPTSGLAAEGDAVAIRFLGDQSVAVENHWGLRVIIGPHRSDAANPFDLHQRHVPLAPLKEHVFSRLPNASEATWFPADSADADPNAIRVASLPRDAESPIAMLVQTDGLRLVVSSAQPIDWNPERLDQLGGPVDVVLFLERWSPAEVENHLAGIRTMKPRWVVFPPGVSAQQLGDITNQITGQSTFKMVDHNTLAVSANSAAPVGDGQASPTVVQLDSKPFELDGELEGLFEKMETACENSQRVFAPLSANQLNFRPSNGTHTPRWNAEHMMGRQLLFFSQIYHAIDPTIPVMDLNPKQMPPDYVAAHPDWDGQEEARQMQRVSAFTRRFAYLLQDVHLDRRAPGSRWTLRGLLRQMERHYDDHTANTQQKFELADWPKQ